MTEGLVQTDPQETVVFINQRLSEMLGYPPEQIMPEMNGRDLAKNLLSTYPGIKPLHVRLYR
jgi:PAS domain-containing protein